MTFDHLVSSGGTSNWNYYRNTYDGFHSDIINTNKGNHWCYNTHTDTSAMVGWGGTVDIRMCTKCDSHGVGLKHSIYTGCLNNGDNVRMCNFDMWKLT